MTPRLAASLVMLVALAVVVAGGAPAEERTENFDKEGVLPIFVLRVQAENGQVIERKYKLNSTTVRRVAGAEDQKIATIKKEEKGGKPKARRR